MNGLLELNGVQVPNGETEDVEAFNIPTPAPLPPAAPGTTNVIRQRNQVAGHNYPEIAEVKNVDPAQTDYALAVRPIPQRCSSGAPVGIIVSNAAIALAAANANRRAIIITNNGSSNIFIGRDNTVTATGATMGIKVIPNGTYSDSGEDLDIGDIWAIGDAVSASANVSVWEKT